MLKKQVSGCELGVSGQRETRNREALSHVFQSGTKGAKKKQFGVRKLKTQNPKPETRNSKRGEVQERFNWHAWRACAGETLPRVRIPASPPRDPAWRDRSS